MSHQLLRAALFLLVGWLPFFLSGCSTSAPAPQYHVAVIASGQSRLVKAESLEQELIARGYTPGEDLFITTYDAENHGDRLPALVEEAIASNPDVLITLGGAETQIAKMQTRDTDIPLVFIGVADTVDWGVVDSFRHPGHHMTGIDNGYIEITSKRLEYLTLLMPDARRVLVLYSSDITPSRAALAQAEEAAPYLGLTLLPQAVDNVAALQIFADNLQPGDADAILITPSYTLENTLATVLLPATLRARVPVIGLNQDIVAAGGLAAYGASFQRMGRQAARLVDKVLNGVPAGSIPVEFPDTPEFSINLQSAEAMELTLDPDAACLADRIFQSYEQPASEAAP